MKRKEEIYTHFKDAYDIVLQGFDEVDLEKLVILMAGFDDAITTMPDAGEFIRTIKYDKTIRSYGKMGDDGISRIGTKGLGSYGTGIHEVVHALDFYRSDYRTNSYADEIIRQARKRTGLGRSEKKYETAAFWFVGDAKEVKKTYEVIAYAVETELGQGMGNDLSRVILEEVKRTQ